MKVVLSFIFISLLSSSLGLAQKISDFEKRLQYFKYQFHILSKNSEQNLEQVQDIQTILGSASFTSAIQGFMEKESEAIQKHQLTVFRNLGEIECPSRKEDFQQDSLFSLAKEGLGHLEQEMSDYANYLRFLAIQPSELLYFYQSILLSQILSTTEFAHIALKRSFARDLIQCRPLDEFTWEFRLDAYEFLLIADFDQKEQDFTRLNLFWDRK